MGNRFWTVPDESPNETDHDTDWEKQYSQELHDFIMQNDFTNLFGC